MNKYKVVGIMSGTSLDGVDLALCTFEKQGQEWKYRIHCAETVAYSSLQRKKLMSLGFASAEQFAAEHASYGKLLGTLAKDFLTRNAKEADFISSHGHTIFHRPQKNFTTQLGDGAALSVACG